MKFILCYHEVLVAAFCQLSKFYFSSNFFFNFSEVFLAVFFVHYHVFIVFSPLC